VGESAGVGESAAGEGVTEAIPHKPTSQLEQFHISSTFNIHPLAALL
jgi:hypothetical protein